MATAPVIHFLDNAGATTARPMATGRVVDATHAPRRPSAARDAERSALAPAMVPSARGKENAWTVCAFATRNQLGPHANEPAPQQTLTASCAAETVSAVKPFASALLTSTVPFVRCVPWGGLDRTASSPAQLTTEKCAATPARAPTGRACVLQVVAATRAKCQRWSAHRAPCLLNSGRPAVKCALAAPSTTSRPFAAPMENASAAVVAQVRASAAMASVGLTAPLPARWIPYQTALLFHADPSVSALRKRVSANAIQPTAAAHAIFHVPSMISAPPVAAEVFASHHPILRCAPASQGTVETLATLPHALFPVAAAMEPATPAPARARASRMLQGSGLGQLAIDVARITEVRSAPSNAHTTPITIFAAIKGSATTQGSVNAVRGGKAMLAMSACPVTGAHPASRSARVGGAHHAAAMAFALAAFSAPAPARALLPQR